MNRCAGVVHSIFCKQRGVLCLERISVEEMGWKKYGVLMEREKARCGKRVARALI